MSVRIRTHLRYGESLNASAKDAVHGLLGMLGFKPDMFAVFEVWDRETRGLIRNCEAVAIQGGRLWVKVPSALHRHELMYSKKRLIDRINQALGRNAITDIVFEFDGTKRSSEVGQSKASERFGRN